MDLFDRIVYVHRNITAADWKFIKLRNDADGRGDYIEHWGHPTLPRPTEEQLNSAVPFATAEQVRAEAQRRIIELTGTTNIIDCLIKQHNAQMRATELTLIKASGGTWTSEQATEAAALQAMAEQIKAIRSASNVLEPNPPSDYTDNRHWP